MQSAAAQSLIRQPTILEGPQQTEVTIGGVQQLNFSSNDYLGWANASHTREALALGAQRYGVGSGASHWVVGHNGAHEYLESVICRWLGCQSVALFATGYLANLGAITALADRDTEIHQDRLNHASLLQAGQLAGRSRRFRHADVDHLNQRLSQSRRTRQLIVTDGVFSMDGDVAPVTGYRQMAQAHDALLMVDDAHGLGVLGRLGRGCCDQLGGVDLLMGTLGKAIGCSGAFVAGPTWLVDSIKQFSKPYTYTTAMAPAMAFAAARNIERLAQGDPAPQQLQARIGYLKQHARDAGIELMPSNTAIQPMVVGDAASAVQLSHRLSEQAFGQCNSATYGTAG